MQSVFKDKINSAKHRERINKWCTWKGLCKSNPNDYKIKIVGDERSVTLMLLKFCDVHTGWTQVETLEWFFN